MLWASTAFMIKCVVNHGTEPAFTVTEPMHDPLIQALGLLLIMKVFDIFI